MGRYWNPDIHPLIKEIIVGIFIFMSWLWSDTVYLRNILQSYGIYEAKWVGIFNDLLYFLVKIFYTSCVELKMFVEQDKYCLYFFDLKELLELYNFCIWYNTGLFLW